ncbi:DUF5361 domain-containing protein, partial [Mycobacterium kansasii]
GIQDRLSMSLWFKTEDGRKGKNRPKLVTDIINKPKEKTDRKIRFHSGEDFEKYRQQLFQKGGGS